MKHKKLSISIVSAFIAALGLTACSGLTAKEDVIAVIRNGHNGETINVSTQDIYDKFKTSEDGIASFYQAILEVLIRNHFESPNASEAAKADYANFKKSAANDVTSDEQRARDAVDSNPSSNYDEEWKKILDEAGVKDEKELYQKHLYKYEKEKYQDKFIESKEARKELTNEFIGFEDDGTAINSNKAKSVYPYHIRHVLVKTEEGATNYTRATISATEARKLGEVFEAFTDDTYGTFSKVSAKSDDPSKEVYGDLGIMATNTQFVNEFKLGLYAYDLVYGKDVTGNAALKSDVLGLDGKINETDTTVKQQIENIKLAEVPFEVFEFLKDNADVEKDNNNNQVNDGEAAYFPRNVIWNNYLNIHNPFVITNDHIPTSLTGKGGNLYPDAPTATANKNGFRHIQGLQVKDASNPEKKVLTDEDGHVIVGVRSQFGIHFMIMERTPFEVAGSAVKYDGSSQNYVYDDTKLTEYYTTYKPTDKGLYPTDAEGHAKATYVNNIVKSEESVYKDRANTVKDAIKGFDTLYDYRMYDALVADGTITVLDDKIAPTLEKYINNKRQYNIWNEDVKMNTAWNEYLDLILAQYEARGVENGGDLNESKTLVKVTCGVNFKDHSGSDWNTEGGACYYEK